MYGELVMAQSHNLKIPVTLHAQLKALAAKRGVTMVDVIRHTVRQAIVNGELPDEVPGITIDFDNDLDVIVRTTAGDLPTVSRGELELLGRSLLDAKPNAPAHTSSAKNGLIEVGFVGTAIEIKGTSSITGAYTRTVMTVEDARDFGRQLVSMSKTFTA